MGQGFPIDTHVATQGIFPTIGDCSGWMILVYFRLISVSNVKSGWLLRIQKRRQKSFQKILAFPALLEEQVMLPRSLKVLPRRCNRSNSTTVQWFVTPGIGSLISPPSQLLAWTRTRNRLCSP